MCRAAMDDGRSVVTWKTCGDVSPRSLLVLAWERKKEETYAHDGAALLALNN